MMRDKKLFITGGTGFIGASLIKRLIVDNEVVVYDNLQGDVLKYDLLKKSIPSDVDLVLHMAAIAGIDTVIKNPVATMEVNMVGAYHLLKALRELKLLDKIERFINFSTSEVFGINAFRVDEKASTNLQPVGEARWTYSVSKLAGEHLTYSYHKQFDLRAVTVRPFNVYGPGQVGEGAIHHFVVRAIKNEPLTIHGEGDQIRYWCYIDDMVDGILLCLEREEAIGEVFNIG
ncbi:MAG: SDR family oxidoreductase, partial [Deltaproteobacteria bacterium]|nr:SDR family oxidoreductase [Deltaproteobacteria bacterium]